MGSKLTVKKIHTVDYSLPLLEIVLRRELVSKFCQAGGGLVESFAVVLSSLCGLRQAI